MNTTASLIENYSKEQRKCVAEGERKLVFFTKYTQRNCQLDNIALRTARKCGAFSLLVFFPFNSLFNFLSLNWKFICFVIIKCRLRHILHAAPKTVQYTDMSIFRWNGVREKRRNKFDESDFTQESHQL